jgi:hypothetical protein
MPRLSPAAPSGVKSTMAKAFRRRSLSRPLWIGDAQNAQAHTEAKVLRIAKPRLDCPTFGVIVHDLARCRLSVVRGQTPGLFHISGLDADDRSNLVPARRDLGVAQLSPVLPCQPTPRRDVSRHRPR